MSNMSVRHLTQMAMLAAISIVIVFFVRFPLIPAAPFLEYTPGDVPLFMAAFLYGPVAGLVLTVVSALVQGFTISAHSGIIGIIMNILSGGSYVLVAGLIYSKNIVKNTKTVVIAMIAGTVATTVVMIGFNLIFTPIFMGVPRYIVMGMIIPAFLPFNILRAGINSVLAYAAWRALQSVLVPYVKTN